MGVEEDGYEYTAFISYRHAKVDRRWAKWLHRTLETYRVPHALVRKHRVPRRLGRCFRDEEELPVSADLSSEIEKALAKSRFLIVVCSPRTPTSEWVNREVERFRELGRGHRIIAVLVEGEPVQAFPRALTTVAGGTFANARVEPLAADVRASEDVSAGHVVRMARLRIVASILGVRFDDLRNREQERRNRRLFAFGSLAAALLIAMGVLTAYAFHQRTLAIERATEIGRQKTEVEDKKREADQRRSEADAQKAIAVIEKNQKQMALTKVTEEKSNAEKRRIEAVAERDNAQAILDFLTDDVLAGARPERSGDTFASEAVVRSVIRPAAELVRVKFADRPLLKATSEDALALTYKAIGRSDLALPLAADALKTRQELLGADHRDTIKSLKGYASILVSLGRSDEAEPLFKDVYGRCTRVFGDGSAEVSQALIDHAWVLKSIGRLKEGEAKLNEARERQFILFEKTNDGQLIESLDRYIDVLKYYHRSKEALPLCKAALKHRIQVLGPDHPLTMSLMSAYASVLKLNGHTTEAEPLLKEALERQTRVLGTSHPETLASLAEYASVLESVSRAPEAESFYKRAVDGAMQCSTLGPKHATTKLYAANYATLLDNLSRPQEATAVRLRYGISAHE